MMKTGYWVVSKNGEARLILSKHGIKDAIRVGREMFHMDVDYAKPGITCDKCGYWYPPTGIDHTTVNFVHKYCNNDCMLNKVSLNNKTIQNGKLQKEQA